MQLLDGKSISETKLMQISSNVTQKMQNIGKAPRMDILIAGDDFASKKYVEMKRSRAERAGIKSVVHDFPGDVDERELIVRILELNDYDDVDGLMVQLPLPDRGVEEAVLEVIDPDKDIDGMTSENLGLLFQNSSEAIAPATPLGIMMLLKEYEIDLVGKNAVVIGRSKIVGKPMAAMLMNEDCTVTVAHSKTSNLKELCQNADILIASAGKAKMVSADMVKQGCVVVDVGIHKDEKSGKLVGDVDFDVVKEKASYITPVPGGVGPMTIAALLQNTIDVWERRAGLDS